VHEQLTLRGNCVVLPDVVIHHDRPRDAAAARAEQRAQRDLARLEESAAADPRDPHTWLYIARIRHAANDPPSAWDAVQRALALRAGLGRGLRCDLHAIAAAIAISRNDPRTANDQVDAGLRVCWNVPDLHCLRAQACLLLGRPASAEAALRTALAIPWVPWDVPTHVRFATWWPCWELGRLAELRGDDSARDAWYRRAASFPLPADVAGELAPWMESGSGIELAVRDIGLS
jgi:tetratricopeptide (TPR) repeat protein